MRIDPKTIEKIRDKYPETYEKAAELIKDKSFKSGIDSIAIPKVTQYTFVELMLLLLLYDIP